MADFEIRRASPPPAKFTRRARPKGGADIHMAQWHGTRGPTTHGKQIAAMENWFATTAYFPEGNNHNDSWGGSSDFGVGYDDRVGRVVIVEFGDWINSFASFGAGFGESSRTTYAASMYGVTIEVAERNADDTISDEEADACAWLFDHINAKLKAQRFEPIPDVWLDYWDQSIFKPIPRGHVTHVGLANGTKLGKTDPGPGTINAIASAITRRHTPPPIHRDVAITYTVRSGDYLGKIAHEYGTTVADIVKWNALADPNKIEVGQKLIVGFRPAVPPAPPADPQLSPRVIANSDRAMQVALAAYKGQAVPLEETSDTYRYMIEVPKRIPDQLY